ncbi:MAG: squalene/phytoene synthase family protein [Candidatus Altiarchaeota archaeon]|nr:squalene/phytoene synthase family protein [Candidatus Altiarchaeota archaeon]
MIKEIFEDASLEFWEHMPKRKTLKLLKYFAPKQEEETVKIIYYSLRFIDDLADLTQDASQDQRLAAVDVVAEIFRNGTSSHTSLTELEESQPVGSALIDRLAYLFHDTLEQSENRQDLWQYFDKFIDGMLVDIQNEGKPFDNNFEFFKYIDALQHYPNMLTLRAIGSNVDENLMQVASYGFILAKYLRGEELLEDLPMGRFYMTTAELEAVDLTTQELLDIVTEKQEDPRLAELVYNRTERAKKYLSAALSDPLANDAEDWIKQFLVAYGHVVRHWVDKLKENEYNPFVNGEVLDVDPGKRKYMNWIGKLKIKSKFLGTTDPGNYVGLADW